MVSNPPGKGSWGTALGRHLGQWRKYRREGNPGWAVQGEGGVRASALGTAHGQGSNPPTFFPLACALGKAGMPRLEKQLLGRVYSPRSKFSQLHRSRLTAAAGCDLSPPEIGGTHRPGSRPVSCQGSSMCLSRHYLQPTELLAAGSHLSPGSAHIQYLVGMGIRRLILLPGLTELWKTLPAPDAPVGSG